MIKWIVAIVLIMAVTVGAFFLTYDGFQSVAYGDSKDTEFASDLWESISDYPNWSFKTELMDAQSPHGKYVRSFYNIVTINSSFYHVIVKDGYGGDGVSRQDVMNSPARNVVSVAVMVQREKGYDPDAGNWYWVRYDGRDGTVTKTSDGMPIAGKFPKCISCHTEASGGDFFFTND